MEKEIKEFIGKMSALDILHNFRNKHLEKYVSASIFSKYYKEMYEPHEVVAVQQQQVEGQTGIPGSVVEKKFRAKDLEATELKVKDREGKFLVVIDTLIEEETRKHA